MNSKNIKFAKEFCFNARSEQEIDRKNLFSIIKFNLPGDRSLCIENSKEQWIVLEIDKNSEDILNELRLYKNRSLLRLDKISGNILTFTLLEFYKSQTFEGEDSFNIVVDQAIMPDLHKFNLSSDNVAKFVGNEILVDGKYCFCYGRENSGSSEVVGERFSFQIEETPQGYLHVIAIHKKNNRDNNIENLVVLVSGNIQVTDRLSNTDLLTSEAQKKYRELTRDNTELIQLWGIYEQLNMECIKQDAQELGVLKYKSFKRNEGKLIFQLGVYINDDFLREDMSYAAIPESEYNAATPMDYNPRMAVPIGIGFDPSCRFSQTFIIDEDIDFEGRIPEKGYIVPDLTGSAIQKKRRDIALQNILRGKNPLIGLNTVIQSGELAGVLGKKRKPVSERLSEKIFGKRNISFTERQKEAISTAINTPDIALIQGPPGTGKTTVIRAIIERIDELENGNARILISSTQHDAVDNAVQKITYAGMPVNRAEKRKNQSTDLPIYGWIENIIDSCDQWLNEEENQSVRGANRRMYDLLSDLKESKGPEERLSLLKEISALAEQINLGEAIYKNIISVISEVQNFFGNDNGNNEKELEVLLDGQRLTEDAFLDDGETQLRRLENYLKFEADFSYEIPDYWKKLRRLKEKNDKLTEWLQRLSQDVFDLREKTGGVHYTDEEFIEKDISALTAEIKDAILKKEETADEKTADIVWEFKQELSNSHNLKEVLETYSKINAATCQQSANKYISPGMKGFDDRYDYVIIDEAARSNPLDLLIPMSMGSKIILVGDHKQLPHMVEPEVVNAVVAKTGDKHVESILEQSLFQRLFYLVQKNDRASGIRRTVVLNEQYRMHPDICDLVNIFYQADGEALVSKCTKEERKTDLGRYENKALVWLDMPITEKTPAETKGKSKSRQCEVDRVKEEIDQIIASEGDDSRLSIGIITFYSAQANLLKAMTDRYFPGDNIEVGTVDAFQGKEFDIVILSMVRANAEKDIKKRVGFLMNKNRLCVAFSRAKRVLIAIGDSNTVAQSGNSVFVPELNELLQRCKKGIGYYG